MEFRERNAYPMRGGKFCDAVKDASLSRDEAKRQIVFNGSRIDGSVNVRMSEYGFQFGTEDQFFVVAINEQRFLAQMIASQEQFVSASVPDRKCKHASQVCAEFRAVIFIQMDENLSV